MAEHAYLCAAAGAEHGPEDRVLLSAKRNVPLGWLLAFAGEGELAASADLAPCRVADARARASAWLMRLRPHVGPKLAATLEGFVTFLAEEVQEAWLLLDATELGEHEVETTREALAAVRRLADDPRGADLTEWGAGPSPDGRLELEGTGAGATYRFFGASETDGDDAWLSPPEPDDAARALAVRAAFAAFAPLGDLGRSSAGIQYLFTHPLRTDLVFAVRLLEDDAYELRVHGSEKDARASFDGYALDFGPLRGSARLGAWAEHVATNVTWIELPKESLCSRKFWGTTSGIAFAARMRPHAPDAEHLRADVLPRLRAAVVEFVVRDGPLRASFDLGPVGSLVLERVVDPAWEPHVRAELRTSSGDAAWRAPVRTYLLSPADQVAIVDRVLGDEGTRIEREGWVLPWLRASTSSFVAPEEGALVLHRGRVAPERFTAGFVLARPRQAGGEAPAKLFFRGERLLVVVADGARLAFRFDAAPVVDATTPLSVSGWWTARSGERFASVLRVGARVYTFDNDGALLRG